MTIVNNLDGTLSIGKDIAEVFTGKKVSHGTMLRRGTQYRWESTLQYLETEKAILSCKPTVWSYQSC